MRQRTIQWEKKETILIGWTEGYVNSKGEPKSSLHLPFSFRVIVSEIITKSIAE